MQFTKTGNDYTAAAANGTAITLQKTPGRRWVVVIAGEQYGPQYGKLSEAQDAARDLAVNHVPATQTAEVESTASPAGGATSRDSTLIIYETPPAVLPSPPEPDLPNQGDDEPIAPQPEPYEDPRPLPPDHYEDPPQPGDDAPFTLPPDADPEQPLPGHEPDQGEPNFQGTVNFRPTPVYTHPNDPDAPGAVLSRLSDVQATLPVRFRIAC